MIRKYLGEDKFRVIELLKMNTPEFFDSSEQALFDNYLDNKLEEYFVYEQNSKIIGAGGINYFPKEKLARLSWDMIDPQFQRKGVGKELVKIRLDHLSRNKGVELIIVRTTQIVYEFYEHMGFSVERIEKNFWAKNFDLYQMVMKNETLTPKAWR